MIKNLAGAKRYVNKIRKGLIKNPFATKDTLDSLKIFARYKDKENFKIVIEFMCSGIKTQKNLKLYAKEPLALVEYFCMTIDQSSRIEKTIFNMLRGIKVKRLPIGNTQKFFQKVYGSHFFKKK